MKKLFAILIFVINFNLLFGQELKNTNWIQIKVERKDGSRVIDRLGTEDADIKISFIDSKKIVLNFNGSLFKSEYQVKNDLLAIKNAQSYKIGFFNDTILTLIDTLTTETSNDKINRHFLINEKYYYQYILSKKLVVFKNDSVIECNRFIYPYFSKGSIIDFIKNRIDTTFSQSFIIGNLLITNSGEVIENNVVLSHDLNEKFIKNYKAVIDQTSKNWIVPRLNGDYYYSLNYTLILMTVKNGKGFTFEYNSKEHPCLDSCGTIRIDELGNSNRFFQEGLNLLTKEDYNDAINSFTDCITINSIYLDAYYNRAYAFFQLKDYKNACADWEYLKNLGQTQGIKLYNEYCKNNIPKTN